MLGFVERVRDFWSTNLPTN